ncbi:MAG: malonate decarboxylase holo-[acyl-carrier-protein] synthase [Burkholderiales bacterium]
MRRHDWVHPHADARPAFLTAENAALAFAHDWIARGRPLVVTRQSQGTGALSLGLALPPGYATRRLPCTLEREAVANHRGPLGVAEAACVLGGHEARVLRRLDEALAALGARVGVYGSTAWQCVSGLVYRHDDSDIDVVCDVRCDAVSLNDLDACLVAMERAARDLRSRLDGEIRFVDGRAVAWRELAHARAAASPLVLAKGERDVALLPWQALVAAS